MENNANKEKNKLTAEELIKRDKYKKLSLIEAEKLLNQVEKLCDIIYNHVDIEKLIQDGKRSI